MRIWHPVYIRLNLIIYICSDQNHNIKNSIWYHFVELFLSTINKDTTVGTHYNMQISATLSQKEATKKSRWKKKIKSLTEAKYKYSHTGLNTYLNFRNCIKANVHQLLRHLQAIQTTIQLLTHLKTQPYLKNSVTYHYHNKSNLQRKKECPPLRSPTPK